MFQLNKKKKNNKETIDILKNKKLIKKNILFNFNGEEFENIEEAFLELIKNNIELGIHLKYGNAVEDENALKIPKTIEQALKLIKNELEDYSEIFELYYYSECNEEDLEFINLSVIEIGNIKIISEEFKYNFLNIGSSIYCDEDNISFSKKNVDEKIIKLLNIPGVYFYLEGEGSSY